jgi:hypothetical protein
MKRMICMLSVAFVFLSMLATGAMAAGTGPFTPPGQPAAGYGSPAITGNHNMSLSSSWIMPDWLMDSLLGGAGKVDAADWRYCWAAMDAAMDGGNTLTFKMGKWSDGVPVKPVLRLAP